MPPWHAPGGSPFSATLVIAAPPTVRIARHVLEAAVLALCLAARPAGLRAQSYTVSAPAAVTAQGKSLVDQILNGDIVGFAVHAGELRYFNGAPPSGASAEVKSFSGMLPGAYEGNVVAAQVLYRTFILNFAATDHTINNINQTNTATGFLANKAHREATQTALSWTHRPFGFGLGKESGTMTFQGPTGKRTLAFDNSYALLEAFLAVSGKKAAVDLSVGYAMPLDFSTGSTHAQTFFSGASFVTLGFVF